MTLMVSELAAQPLWRKAVGDLSDLPASARVWFTDATSFGAMSDPWGKTVSHYLQHWHNRPKGERKTIVVRWLEEPDSKVSQEELKRYLEAFFQLPVRVEVSVDFRLPRKIQGKFSADKIRRRLRDSIPDDAFTVIGLLNKDIYSEDNGPRHLLFGEGHYYDRTAVASVARLQTEDRRLFKHRLFKLLAHELVHTFSVEHCGYFQCLMNPSGSMRASDARPIFLCPVCLRKQQVVLKFDPKRRYEQLLEALKPSLAKDARWLRQRLKL